MRLLANIFSNWIRFGVIAAVAFLLSPFLVHRLGASDYGLWSLTLSTVTYFSLLDLGINAGVVRFVARDAAIGNVEGLRRTVATSHLFLAIAAAAILALTFLGTAIVPHVFKLKPEDIDKARVCFFLAGLDLAATFCFAVWNASLVGLQRFAEANAWTLSLYLAKTLVLVLLVRAGFGVRTVALLSVAETALRGAGLRLLARRYLPDTQASFSSADRGTFREIASYGLYAFVIAASIKVIGPTDLVVVGGFLSTEDVTRYDVGSKLVNPFYDLLWAAGLVLTPLSTELQARGDEEGLRRLHLLGTKGAIVLAFPIVFFFVAAGRDFIRRWMGDLYAGPSYPILALLGTAQLVAIAQQPSVAMLRGIGRVRVLAILYAGEALANLVLSIALVRRLGLVGVALGTVFPLVISNGILLPLYLCRSIGMPVARYLREAIVPALLPAVPAFLVGLAALKAVGPITTYPGLLAALLFGAALFWVPAAFVTLTASERRALLERARSFRRATKSPAPSP